MKPLIRVVASALLVGSLITAITAAPARADTGPGVATAITLSDACAKLADLIAFLASRPSGPLRDFLLAQARRLELRYCSSRESEQAHATTAARDAQ